MTGGLGPTHDDITKQTLSIFLELPLFTDKEYLEKLRNRFKKHLKVSDNNNESQDPTKPVLPVIKILFPLNFFFNKFNFIL